MALSTKTLKVLKDANLDGADVALFSDEDLLALPGVGPAVLADIRATYPAPAAGASVARSETAQGDTIDDLVGAAVRAGVTAQAPLPPPVEPTAPPPVGPPADLIAAGAPAAPGCVCKQPFKVTRTRQRSGRIERYCDACGAVAGATQTTGR